MWTIETFMEMLKTMSEEEWNELYRQAESTSESVDERITAWNNQEEAAVTAWNYMYRMVEQGRESELPEPIRKLVDEWNKR